MPKFESILYKAAKSGFYLGILNRAMWKRVPFNKPHRFKIRTITENGFEVTIPYIKKNFNHIRGIHACALATASEYVTGLTILRKIGMKDYRLIMESLQMKYHYQAKQNVVAKFELTDNWIVDNIKKPLENADDIYVVLTVEIHDSNGNHISTGTTRWQIKKWDKVKTTV